MKQHRFLFASALLLVSMVSFALFSASAKAGWRDWPKAPTVLSADAVVNGQSMVRFVHSDFSGKRVKVYAMLRYRVDKDKEHPTGIAWADQSVVTVLDKSGNGSILLKNLKDRKTYNVMVSLRQLEPHVVQTQTSKLKKLRNTR